MARAPKGINILESHKIPEKGRENLFPTRKVQMSTKLKVRVVVQPFALIRFTPAVHEEHNAALQPPKFPRN